MANLSQITFLESLDEGAKDIIIRYHETGDLSNLVLIERESGHGTVYRLSEYPYVIKEYKQADLNRQDHFILMQLLECPYAPRLYAYVDHKFFVMEYVEGLSIQNYLNKFHKLPNGFYHQLRLALYEIAWSANFILGDMKVEDSVLINGDTGNIKILDYGVGDQVGDFPKEVALQMAHSTFLSFLALIRSYQLFSKLPEAEEDFFEALITQKKTGTVDHFYFTENREILRVFAHREELELERESMTAYIKDRQMKDLDPQKKSI